ncbi:MAG TPA: hypothetical protein PKK06_00350 [Phycisphaerae bacterium]|nr:hypothetical protein [Phycisphaerae bacterium]HNU43941.1 hypothetical protein [Phycisphaerae bacterium]
MLTKRGRAPGAGFVAIVAGDYHSTGVKGFARGDLDHDRDVDRDDFGVFFGCFTGPGGGLPTGCGEADLDGDTDVDLADFAIVQLNRSPVN